MRRQVVVADQLANLGVVILCSVLDALDQRVSKLVDLCAYLEAKLPEESTARAVEVINDLRALFDLRVWRQHSGTEDRATRGMSRLGISLPVYEWSSAWQHIQARTVAALSAPRDEVETLARI